jgi:hypothetical protein
LGEIIRHCKECDKKFKKDCPIRVWGRNEENKGKFLDIDPESDFCSRFIEKVKE